MREERLEVSVTFDERRLHRQRAGAAAAVVALTPGRPAPQDRGAAAAR